MKVNNRTIVITDPCYIFPKGPKYQADRESLALDGDEEVLTSEGFTDFIIEDTGVGDWVCRVLDTKNTDPEVAIIAYYDDAIKPSTCNLGFFTADSGMVSVFYLDEILKFNPKFRSPNEYDVDIATIIEGFTGEVEMRDIESVTHVIGKGSTNFASVLK